MNCMVPDCSRPVLCTGLCERHYHQKRRKTHRKHILRLRNSYRFVKAKEIKKQKASWYQRHVERGAVQSHWNVIFRTTSENHRYYEGMPFYPLWNPKMGGSYENGAQWIISNIGRRPNKDYHLHIINRQLGFVPGNLVWIPRNKHRQEEMIAKLLLEIQSLKVDQECDQRELQFLC